MALPTPKPSRLHLVPIFLKVGAAIVLRIFISPFRGSKGAPIYKTDVLYAGVRALLSNLGPGFTTTYAKTTDKVYELEAIKHNIPKNIVDLGDGSKGHWFGPSNAKYVLLFFHGGGYEGHATPGHAKYQIALQKTVRDAGHDFAIFAPSYSLSSKAKYPKQLHQATAALKYLIETEKRDPQTILVGGDSAGGNLAIELLLHLAKPHPEVPALSLPSRLRGAVFISPWVSFDTTTQAFKTNDESDYLTPVALNRASKSFLGNPPRNDEYSEPIRAPPEWWAQVAETVCDEVLIWGGGGEILIDGIRGLAKNIAAGYQAVGAATTSPRKGGERVLFVETPRASHEEQIMNVTLKVPTKGQESLAIEEWILAKL